MIVRQGQPAPAHRDRLAVFIGHRFRFFCTVLPECSCMILGNMAVDRLMYGHPETTRLARDLAMLLEVNRDAEICG